MDTAVNLSNSGQGMRAQVAACTRLLNMAGILHYSGHVSVRAPGKEQLYIQSREQSRAEVTPDSILLVDFDGNVVEGDDKPPSELVIHTEIYRARADVGAVVHNHMELATAVTLAKGAEVKIMDFHAVRWASGVPVMREAGHINTKAACAALARARSRASEWDATPAQTHAIYFKDPPVDGQSCGPVRWGRTRRNYGRMRQHQERILHCSPG